jgi:uncharacterized protein
MVIALVAAVFCVWGALCLIFWQGSWQLLYHPASAVKRTPSAAGLAFESIEFGVDQSGQPQLRGWWIPGQGRYTAISLHGADGNLGDTVAELNLLHGAGLNLLAFDYRGYGLSRFVHPSEASWREDAETALRYLMGTRHVPVSSIILVGNGLGANLALEEAAQHPGLAGVVIEEPIGNPMQAIFNDPRARLVPAHLLVRDRWDINAAATTLRVPSFWIYQTTPPGQIGLPEPPDAFHRATSPKMLVWLTGSPQEHGALTAYLTRWTSALADHGRGLPVSELAPN